MKKYLTILLGLFVSAGVSANPQIDMDADNSCHFPLAHWAASQELNIDTSKCDAAIAEVHGEAEGYCHCKLNNVPEDLLQYVFWTTQRITTDGLVRVLKIDSDRSRHFACHLDADNGSNYDSYNWKAKIVYNEENQTLKASLVCNDAH